MSVGSTTAPTRGVPVTLDRERHLRYSFATRKQMLAELGGEEALRSGLTGDMLPKVLWYGLKHEDAALTVEQVEEMLDMENLQTVVKVMLKAMGYEGKLVVGGEAGNPPQSAPAAAPGAESAST